MAEEKRVRVVFESVGGTAAAQDASRLQESLGGVAAAEDATAESTAALRAEIDRYRSQVNALQQAQQSGQQAQQRFAQGQQQASLSAIELTTKLAGASNAIASMATALGGDGAAAGLIGKLASGVAAGAQLGAALGPQGALVGGILGAAIPAVTGLTEAFAASREEAERRLDSIREREIPSWRDLAAAIRSTAQEEAQLGELRAGVRETADQQGFIDEQNAIIGRHVATRIELERQRATLIGLSDAAHTIQNTWRALHDEQSIEQEIEGLERAIARQRDLTRQAQAEARARIESANALPRGADLPDEGFEAPLRAAARGGGRDASRAAGRDDGAAWVSGWEDALRDAEESTWLRQWSEEMRVGDEQHTVALRRKNEELERELGLKRKLHEAEEEFARTSLARLQRQVRQRTEVLNRETERREQELKKFSDLASGVSRSLVDAVSSIASGAQSAEEAFKGMLASFLTSIAEMALVEAAKEEASKGSQPQRQGGRGSEASRGEASCDSPARSAVRLVLAPRAVDARDRPAEVMSSLAGSERARELERDADDRAGLGKVSVDAPRHVALLAAPLERAEAERAVVELAHEPVGAAVRDAGLSAGQRVRSTFARGHREHGLVRAADEHQERQRERGAHRVLHRRSVAA